MTFNNPSIKVLIAALLILLGCKLQAQSLFEIELVALLKSLEIEHSVSFNYLNEDLENFYVIEPEKEVPLEEVLGALQSNYPLEFNFVSEKNITVTYLESVICLQFINANSNTPVSNVEVTSNALSLGRSNRSGKIFIDTSVDMATVQFSHPNYFNTQGSLSASTENECQVFYLFPEIDLDEVVIKEYLTKGITLNPDNSLKITPQEFGVLPGLINADVLHSLQYVPGIVNTDETIAQINVRGGTHDQNLVLWNGSRLYQTGHFFGMISAINPLLNTDIEVIKNGSSAFYNEGVSSVIAINSREHTEDFQRTFQLDLLSANAASVIDLNKKSTLQVAARRSLTDMWESPTYKGFTNKVFQNTEIQDLLQGRNNRVTTEQQLQFYDVSLQYDYEIDADNRIDFDVLGIQNRLNFDEVLETTGEQKRNDFKQENFLANLRYSRDWSENHSTSLAFNTSFYELEALNQSVLSNQDLLQTNQVVDLKLSIRHDHTLSDRLTLSAGYQLNEVGVRNISEVTSPDVIIREKQVLTTHSVIAELDYNSRNGKFSSKFGWRGNHYSELSDFRLEPRLNFSYQANRYWRWNLLGEIKNQTLTQVIDQQQDFLGVERRRWVLANGDNYPVITNQQIEVSVNFNKKGWMWQGSLYHKNVEGISSGSQGFQNQLEFLQLNGNYEVLGAEVLLQKRLDQFNFWVNFSWMDNTYDFTNFDPQQFANNFEITKSSAFGISYSTNQFQLSLGGRYFAGRPTTEIDTENPILTPDTNPRLNFLSPNESNLEDYLQVNLTVTYRFLFSNSSVKTGFSILNLLNTNNLTQQFFRLDDSSTSVENVRIRSLELTPNAFISIQF